MAPLRVLDLFSGIGGFSLGLERTGGFRTIAFCEIEPFCRAILKNHWPHVPVHEDIRILTADEIGAVDVICGGFPCQDISFNGHGAGITGERSGLWREIARLVSELRPRYVIVENVAALLGRGIERVLGDLAALRYDAEWHCIPASAVGAPHLRDRVWIIAYPADQQTKESMEGVQTPRLSRQLGGILRGMRFEWMDQPAILRVDDGLPVKVDDLEALGNAVIPKIPEIIGRAILETESRPQP